MEFRMRAFKPIIMSLKICVLSIRLKIRSIPWKSLGSKIKAIKLPEFRLAAPWRRSPEAKSAKPAASKTGITTIRRWALCSKITGAKSPKTRNPKPIKTRPEKPAKKSWRSKVFNFGNLVWILIALMVLAGVLYIQASRKPDNYHPVQRLTAQEADRAAHQFIKDVGEGFSNNVKLVEPFEWSITQKKANTYLASMDEIAFNLTDNPRGKLNKEMDRLGLADPAVGLQDGKVTLMIRSTEYNKILSAVIAVKVLDNDKLKLSLSATRIGRLPVPRSILTDRIKELAGTLGGRRSDAISDTLARLLSAIDGEPISPPDLWRIARVKVGIEAITIADGVLTLKVRPIGPKSR